MPSTAPTMSSKTTLVRLPGSDHGDCTIPVPVVSGGLSASPIIRCNQPIYPPPFFGLGRRNAPHQWGRVLCFLALLTRRTAPFLNGLGTNPNELDGANSTEENNPKLRREVHYLFLFSWVRGCVWNRECPPGTHIPGGHSFGGRNQGKELKPLIPATASQPA